MKYSLVDRFEDFEFHDSRLTFESWKKDKLVVYAKYLNVHKDAFPDVLNSDMEIALARITFTGIKVREFEPSRKWHTDENGKFFIDEPFVIHKDKKAENLFYEELRYGIEVLGLDFENNEYKLTAIGIDPYFSVRFTFSSIEVEWDDYRKKAWYELHRQYNRHINLITDKGEITEEMSISCHEKDVDFNGNDIELSYVSVKIRYNGKDYWGHANDCFWGEAFADLQRALPEGVKLKCCMTCRHGNKCPVGNTPDELFCTSDVTIKEKSDLFFYTEDYDEIEKRTRKPTDCCENFKEQSDDYYTYNDYLYYLKKRTTKNS